MSDLAVIGSKNVVQLFGLLGLQTFFAESGHEAEKHLDAIIKSKEIKIVFLVESLAFDIKAKLLEIEDLDHLTVVPIPDHRSEVNFIDGELKRLSKEAIGMEV